ncbi:hypothetical protein [Shewanella sp. Isolate11]|uniref:hypothetical protein n=1 Tax=Shewanella sp. Isolate11 TaxID=2908530 RepID=UPI001EFC58FE|nr:hypothetical protein [Shewanella sp. Isolate11]MCG9697454.1 hypothetical protein [Shewanella sp. Isolate11]
MNELNKIKRAYYQNLAECNIDHYLNWFDRQIQLHKQAIRRWPHERAIFTRMINQCEQAKQKMIAEHQQAKQEATTE